MKPIAVPTTHEALLLVGKELDEANYLMNASDDRLEKNRAYKRAIECERAIEASPCEFDIDNDDNLIPVKNELCPLLDGEVLGLGDDGVVLLWDATSQLAKSSDLTAEKFLEINDAAKLSDNEKARIGLPEEPKASLGMSNV